MRKIACSDHAAVLGYYEILARAVKIPIMVQDHPISGVPMSAEFMAKLAAEIENLSCFKLEFTHSPYKIGGESGVCLLEEYERSGQGTMPGCCMPQVYSEIEVLAK